MTKDNVLVFDIGSSKMRAMVAGRGVNGTYIVRSQAVADYDGFYEGKFLDENGLVGVMKDILVKLDYNFSKHDNKVYIGVPAEFSSVVQTSANVNFGDRKKIKKRLA